jgi:glycosyltransferase involved in cell wall biosynthesis
LEKLENKEESYVRRLLHLEGDLEYYEPGQFLLNHRRNQRENSLSLDKVIKEFDPDILFIWGMWSISKAVAAQAERILPSRVVYYLSDYWPMNKDRHTVYWEDHSGGWYLRVLKRLLKYYALSVIAWDANPELKLARAITVSKAVKDILIAAGLPLQSAQVIYGGTDVRRFERFTERDFSARPLRLLYAGQLEQHKGVHTAIEAVSRVIKTYGHDQVKLSIVGSGHPKYLDFILDKIKIEGLETHVDVFGPVSKDAMPAIMQQHAVLVFPSIYEEPFARMTQEAMLSGMVVAATPTGGTKEILVDGKNGLSFPPEDAEALANRLGALIEDPRLCQHLAEHARQTVLENYALSGMVDNIEKYLADVCKTSARN